jgi:hypothetical protein
MPAANIAFALSGLMNVVSSVATLLLSHLTFTIEL